MILGFSKVTATVLLFGFGLLGSGMLIQVFRGAFVNRIKDMYWIGDTPFLNLMNVEYNIIALVIMITGIICVFISAAEARSQKVSSE